VSSRDQPAPSEISTQRLAAYLSLGVGVVGLGVGTGFWLRSSTKNDEARALCNVVSPVVGGPACLDESELRRWQQLRDDSRSAQTVSTMGFVTAGIGLITGAALLLFTGADEPASPAAQRPSVEPLLGLGVIGVSGRF
jgi:hypothetical protein